MSNVVTIKADDSNMRETTDIVDKLNKLFDGTSLVAEIVTKETRSMNGKTSDESYIKIEKGDWMEKNYQNNINKVSTEETIVVEVTIGDGTEKSPYMLVKQYWTKSGKLIGQFKL